MFADTQDGKTEFDMKNLVEIATKYMGKEGVEKAVGLWVSHDDVNLDIVVFGAGQNRLQVFFCRVEVACEMSLLMPLVY